eukprot:978884-Rhodomonas_salina.4
MAYGVPCYAMSGTDTAYGELPVFKGNNPAWNAHLVGSAICLRARYATSGTDYALAVRCPLSAYALYAMSGTDAADLSLLPFCETLSGTAIACGALLSVYAPAMHMSGTAIEHGWSAIGLRASISISGSGIGYAIICLRACQAMTGTDVRCGATRTYNSSLLIRAGARATL